MDMFVRLIVAVALSGLVGVERELSHHGAGLRTQMTVGIGAALFAIAGESLGDSRVAAQIVTGVGFLGVGAIIRDGMGIKGLTTAAGLWAVAAIGLAAGIGQLDLAVISTLILVAVLFLMRPLERFLHRFDSLDET